MESKGKGNMERALEAEGSVVKRREGGLRKGGSERGKGGGGSGG